jgi:hypothetical protein
VSAISNSMKTVAAGLVLGGLLFAQTPAAPKSPTAPHAPKASGTAKAAPKTPGIAEWRSECSKAGGFCVQVPQAWKALGDVFDGAGFVVAEPDAKKQQEDWNQITAAATDMPEGANGQERPSTDELIDIILGSPSSGIHAQTIQRTRSLISGMPAEVLKVRLRAKESTADAIEYIALLDDGETIYSVALGCSPEDATRLEPVFDHVLHSWRATPPTSAPSTPAPATPKGTPETQAPPKI